MALTHVLVLCLPIARPIGITEVKPVVGHKIVNMDMSNYASGHLAYMPEFDTIEKVLWMNRE
jgi:hypothetical protein